MLKTVSINEILKEVENKSIVLPDFQRKYTWKKQQVIDYLNSLYREHPTGTFLFWDSLDKSTGKSKRFLCDGQQRITSLFYVVKNEVPKLVDDTFRGVKPTYTLYFNPYGKGEITAQKPTQEEVATLPVTEILDTHPKSKVIKKVEKLMKESQVDELMIKDIVLNINKCMRILDYKYSYHEIDTDDLSEAVEIFNNVNQQGTKLTPGDLAYASVSSRVEGFRKKYDDFEILLNHKYNFKADAYFFMRLLSVMCGQRAKIESHMYKYGAGKEKTPLSDKELIIGWEKLEKTLTHVFDAFGDQLGIEDYKNEIPVALYSLIVLCSYLSQEKKLTFKNEDDINEWIFWVLSASVSERYSGAGGDFKLETDIYHAKNREISTLIKILQEVEEKFIDYNPEDKKITFYDTTRVKNSKPNSTGFKLYRLMIKNKGATDWSTSLQFYPRKTKTDVTSPEIDHIFPKNSEKVLLENGQDTGLIDNLPNRMILMKKTNAGKGAIPPELYLPEMFKKSPKSFKQQMVPENKSSWRIPSFNSFIELRSKMIADELNKWILSFRYGIEVEAIDKIDWDNLPDEGKTIEYKASFETNFEDREIPQEGKVAEVLKTVCAFANTNGGTIFFGISDDKQILNLDYDMVRFANLSDAKRKDKLSAKIIETINGNLKPDGKTGFNGFNDEVKWYPENVDVPRVAYIKIDPSYDHEVTYRDDIYIRKGAGDYKLPKKDYANWLKARKKL